MTATEILRPTLIILAWVMALSWLHRSVMALRGMASVLDLTLIDKNQFPGLTASHGPDVTVVVPARDEQDSISDCLESLRRSEGVRAQIIAIDDRSNDRTGEFMDAAALASRDGANTVEVIHNRDLPPKAASALARSRLKPPTPKKSFALGS